MDKLDKLYNEQKKLIEFYHKLRPKEYSLDKDKKLFIHAVALLMEVAEFIQGLNWKPWKNKKELDRDYLKEELIDMLHFWLELCIYLDIDPQEIFETYMKKNQENRRRQKEVKEYKAN